MLAICSGFGMLVGCTSQGEWLQQVIEAQPHLANRIDAPHRVAVLDSGRDALHYRIERIRAAVTSVKAQTFILDDEPTTRMLMHELVVAARRGVRVQFLADTMFSAKNAVYAASLVSSHPNFELRVYNPASDTLAPGTLTSLGIALIEFNRINQRMHNKLMVIDGTWGICGGRNYQDKYFDEDYRLNYRDRDVAVRGPVVADMEASFDSYWTHLASIPADKLSDVTSAIAALSEDELRWPFSTAMLGIEGLAARIDRSLARGPIRLRWHDVRQVAFWADSPGKPPDRRRSQQCGIATRRRAR